MILRAFRFFLGGALALSFVFLLSTTPARAALLTIESATTVADQGDSVDIDVWVRSLGADIVGSFDTNFNFDESVFSFSAVSFGTHLGGAINSIQTATVGSNTVAISEFSFDPNLGLLQTGADFLLFTVTLDAIVATASTSISLSGAIAPNNDFLLNEFSGVISVDPVANLNFEISSVVGAIPISGTLWLLFLGAILLSLLRWKTGFQGRYVRA